MAKLTQELHPPLADEPAIPLVPTPRITKILVPFDFGDPAARALAYARALAEKHGASIELLHVVADPRLAYLPFGEGSGGVYVIPDGLVAEAVKRGEERIAKALSTRDRQELRASAKVSLGDPREAILAHAAADRVDLIVMGTHGRKGLAHAMLGSVAERVVRTATCPVLTVR